VLFTFSRVVILLFFVCIAVLLVSKFLPYWHKKVHSFTPLLLVERFSNLLTTNDSSIQDRISLLKVSIQVIKENLVLGTGVGSFVKAMEEYVPRTGKGILLLQPVHNIFVLLLSELGIVGSLSILPFLYRVFFLNVKRISLLGILVLCPLVTVGMVDHYLVSLPQGMILISCFILLFIGESKGLKQYENDVNKD
jgi:O-antigen ligase